MSENTLYINVKVLQVRLQHAPDLMKSMPRSVLCYLFNYYTWIVFNTAVNVTSYYLSFALQGNETTNGGANNHLCANNIQVPQGGSKTFSCSPKAYGRYLYIRLPGRNQFLTLCEVEVYSYLKTESKSAFLSSCLFCRYMHDACVCIFWDFLLFTNQVICFKKSFCIVHV